MKKTIIPLFCSAFIALVLTACNKELKETETTTEVDAATIARIQAKGFDVSDIMKVDGGYLVEGDILLHDDDLKGNPNSPQMIIASEEQYHTFNLVNTANGKRNITVSVGSGFSTNFINNVDAALKRYNDQNLQITFSRVNSGGNIQINLVSTNQYIASAGFPSGGNPYNEIKYAQTYTSYSAGFVTTVLAHEIGHCIGFRHTDYMNRAFSCGGRRVNEGQTNNGVGAVHIPGTPTGPDAASWMLACLGSTTNRPFNNNDITALNYVY